MRRIVGVIVVLLIPLACSLLPTTVHAATISGTFTGTSVNLSSMNDTNGNTVYLYKFAGNATGTFTGPFAGFELDTIHSDGTDSVRGADTTIGSYHGSPTGSIICQYSGSLTAAQVTAGYSSFNEVCKGGNYGMTGLEVLESSQSQVTTCNSEFTVCSFSGNYTDTSATWGNY